MSDQWPKPNLPEAIAHGDIHAECKKELALMSEELGEEIDEQCRLNAMGAEREAALLSKLSRSEELNRELIASLEKTLHK